MSGYKKDEVDFVYDFCCAACSFHISHNTEHFLVKVTKKDREAVKPLIENLFHSKTEQELAVNIELILEYEPKFISW